MVTKKIIILLLLYYYYYYEHFSAQVNTGQGCQPSVNLRTVRKYLTQNDLSVKVRKNIWMSVKKRENIHKVYEVKQTGKYLFVVSSCIILA